jgi:hypothetical protein
MTAASSHAWKTCADAGHGKRTLAECPAWEYELAIGSTRIVRVGPEVFQRQEERYESTAQENPLPA